MGPRKRQPHGFSLVEVMVSMTLGLLILAALLRHYDDSKASFRTQDGLSRLQENARHALFMLHRDLRMVGYRACRRDGAASPFRNILNTPTAFLYHFESPVQGFEALAGGGWSPALPAGLTRVVPGTDVLSYRGVVSDGVTLRQAMADMSADLVIAGGLGPRPFEAGDIVMISDCAANAVFQVTQYFPASGIITHNAGSSPGPGNHTTDLGRRFPAGAQLHKLVTASYFIRASSHGEVPSLWRKRGDSPAEELVEGVQNLQVQYGVDTDGDQTPDVYLNADAVSDFRHVVSLRLALLFRSLESAGPDRDTRRFPLLDQELGPFNDGRLAYVATTTVVLRNRAM